LVLLFFVFKNTIKEYNSNIIVKSLLNASEKLPKCIIKKKGNAVIPMKHAKNIFGFITSIYKAILIANILHSEELKIADAKDDMQKITIKIISPIVIFL